MPSRARRRLLRPALAATAIAAALAARPTSTATSTAISAATSTTMAAAPDPRIALNGLAAGQAASGGGLDPFRAMVWKYVAVCALRADQELPPPPGSDSAQKGPKGGMGLAPEWLAGTCDGACREKVSACLLALTNRTGKHVLVSMLSTAAGMREGLAPSENDRDFPHQEGAFFGNVFGAGAKAFACHGRDGRKGPQVKRFCAVDPASCSGLFPFTDAGSCEEVCEQTCSRLRDGSQRCAASVCRDPSGHAWKFPITTYMRNRIEAANADELTVAGDVAIYRRIDFGVRPRAHRTFSAELAPSQATGQIEIALASGRRLGVLTVPADSGTAARELSATLPTGGLSGPQDLSLRFAGGQRLAGLATIELR